MPTHAAACTVLVHITTYTQDYSRQHGLPGATRAKGLTALELRFHSRRLIDESVVLRFLHPALRADIVWEAQRALVDASGLLQACRCVCTVLKGCFHVPGPHSAPLQRSLLLRCVKHVAVGGDILYEQVPNELCV